MKKPETYIIIFALFALLAVVNLLVSAQLYQRTSGAVVRSGGTNGHSESTRPETAVSDIKTLLAQSSLRRNSYQLIADKNLFSSQRTAWQALVVEKTETGEVVVSQARRTDVVLYGTFMLGEKMGALLEFTSLKPSQRKKTMFAGDKVSSETGRKSKSYTLIKVEPASVVIKDHKGIVFHIDLHDGKKRNQKVASTKASISVTSESSVKEPSAVVVGSSHSAEAATVVKARKAAVQMQQKVDSGELQKVNTPFGPAYIKGTATKGK